MQFNVTITSIIVLGSCRTTVCMRTNSDTRSRIRSSQYRGIRFRSPMRPSQKFQTLQRVYVSCIYIEFVTGWRCRKCIQRIVRTIELYFLPRCSCDVSCFSVMVSSVQAVFRSQSNQIKSFSTVNEESYVIFCNPNLDSNYC